jgi:hypothetical protein
MAAAGMIVVTGAAIASLLVILYGYKSIKETGE